MFSVAQAEYTDRIKRKSLPMICKHCGSPNTGLAIQCQYCHISVTGAPVTTVRQRDFKDRPLAELPAKSGKRTIEKQVSRSKNNRKQIAVRLPRNLSRGKQFAPSDNRRHAQASGVSGATSTGRRLVVALNGSTKFRSIQQAINNANPGDTVVVKPGVYREKLILKKT